MNTFFALTLIFTVCVPTVASFLAEVAAGR